jgi:hypothetical protein
MLPLSDLQKIFDAEISAVDVMNQLLLQGVELVRSRLVSALCKSESSPFIGEILESYSSLSPAHQVRALLSSDIGAILRCHDLRTLDLILSEPELQELSNSLKHERALEQFILGNVDEEFLTSLTAESGFWTPMADAFIDKSAAGIHECFAAPIVGGSIVVDFASPLATSYQARSGVLSQPRKELTDDEKDLVIEKLSAALSVIDEIEPVYGAMIRNFNRRIVVRKSINDKSDLKPGQPILASEHTFEYPGSIRLLNPHLAQKTQDQMVESLLHESMHCMMALQECVAREKLSHNYGDFRPVSPWSGNAIPNASFAHAVFVYYVCFRFFEKWRVMREKDMSTDEVDRLSSRSAHFASGFLLVDRVSDCLIADGAARAELVRMIDETQQHVVNAVRSRHLEVA